jgi:hypothetical protein
MPQSGGAYFKKRSVLGCDDGLIDRGFVGALLAFVVCPGDADALALLTSLEVKFKKWIF